MKRSTLRWFSHIERMGNEEFVKKVYLSSVEGTNRRERPLVRCGRVKLWGVEVWWMKRAVEVKRKAYKKTLQRNMPEEVREQRKREYRDVA